MTAEDDYFFSMYFKVIKEFENTTIKISNGEEDCEEDYYEFRDISFNIKGATDSGTGTGGTGEGSTSSTGKLILSSENVEGKAGEDVTIPIKIQENSGFATLGVTVKYDTRVFTYKSFTFAGSFLSNDDAAKHFYDNGNGQVNAAFVVHENMIGTGAFANLVLTIKPGTETGKTSKVETEIREIENEDGDAVEGTGTEATVTVKEVSSTPEYTKGDVNEDGKIDLLDALYILKYYNGAITSCRFA